MNKFLEPHISVEVKSFSYNNKRIEILCIDPAYRQPVKFKKIAYVRIGTAQQPLSNYPERERALWQITSRYSFETTFLKEHMTKEEIVEAFGYKQLLTAIGQKPPSMGEAFDYMQQAGLIKGDLQGKYEISALWRCPAQWI